MSKDKDSALDFITSISPKAPPIFWMPPEENSCEEDEKELTDAKKIHKLRLLDEKDKADIMGNINE